MLQKIYCILVTVPYNYFNGLTKLFSDLCLAKFFTLAKPFFPCNVGFR